jgi:glycosyltransferase involved in cell wall biosynthesis
LSLPRTQLSIVVPAYNEARRIGETLEILRAHVPALVPDCEIRVVDDGSEDQTAAIVEEAARQDSRVVLQREPHRGKGATVKAGMLAATGDLRFMCDADLSMPIHELPRFLDAVPGRADIAIGSREGIGARRVGEPPYRHLLGRVFNRAVKGAALAGINDTQCGFKLFTAEAVELVFPRTTIEGWAFDVEVLYIARRRNLRVLELPIEWHYRDQSRVSAIRDPLRMLRDVLTIRGNDARGAYET